jgi:aryl-alcohol dehydrogenase-like predicted oxidoreductase
MLQRAVELGIDFTDTAHVYGLDDMERLIRGALSP